MPKCSVCSAQYLRGNCSSTLERQARCDFEAALQNPVETPDISPELAAELGLRPPSGGSEFPAEGRSEGGLPPQNFPHTQGRNSRVVPVDEARAEETMITKAEWQEAETAHERFKEAWADKVETPVERHLRIQRERQS